MMGHNLVIKSGNSPFCRSLKLGIQILTEDERKETIRSKRRGFFTFHRFVENCQMRGNQSEAVIEGSPRQSLILQLKQKCLKRIFDVRKSLNCHIDRGVKLLLLLGNGRWSSGHDGVGVKGFDKSYYAKLPYWACNEARVVCAFASSVSRSDLNKRFGCFE